MKKKYESPMAEKVEFNYTENVVASTGNGISYATTDYHNPQWTCDTRYADAQRVCGQDGHEWSSPQWYCNNI